MPLSKRNVLEYLQSHPGSTAKVVGIDLDASAANATELLERCTAQGLCTRDSKMRPREYALTTAGKERLVFLSSPDGRENPGPKPSADAPSLDAPAEELDAATSSAPGSDSADTWDADGMEFLSREVAALVAEISAMRNALRDFIAGFAKPPASDAEPSNPVSRVQSLLQQARTLGKHHEENRSDPRIRELYEAGGKLVSLGFFDFADKAQVREKIGELEAGLGQQTANAVRRLLELESDEYFLGDEEADEVAQLRQELNLPASVQTAAAAG